MTSQTKPLKIPATLQIGPYRWTVVHDAEEFKEYEVRTKDPIDDLIVYGALEAREQKIYLDPNMADDMKVETLLHEVLHAIIFSVAADWENEEAIVSAMSPAILDSLRRNPQLVQALI